MTDEQQKDVVFQAMNEVFEYVRQQEQTEPEPGVKITRGVMYLVGESDERFRDKALERLAQHDITITNLIMGDYYFFGEYPEDAELLELANNCRVEWILEDLFTGEVYVAIERDAVTDTLKDKYHIIEMVYPALMR